MARAFDWQSKGDQFDSDILHKVRNQNQVVLATWFFIVGIPVFLQFFSISSK